MGTPGFTASASLGAPIGHYRARSPANAQRRTVLPQLDSVIFNSPPVWATWYGGGGTAWSTYQGGFADVSSSSDAGSSSRWSSCYPPCRAECLTGLDMDENRCNEIDNSAGRLRCKLIAIDGFRECIYDCARRCSG
jgi:hypothetical protein